MTLFHQPSEFDILFKNLFDTESTFNTLKGFKSSHPVDIYEQQDQLVFEIACTGLAKEDIQIEIDQDVFRVSYSKPQITEELERTYQTKGIARRSFDIAYRVAPKYLVSKAIASMENGLLIITMPFAEEAKSKQLVIN